MATLLKHISKEDINKLPLFRYKGAIQVVHTKEGLSQVVEALQMEKVLGFDTETRPAFQKGLFYSPSIVQLAASERVFIFQIDLLGGLGALVPLFSEKSIIKAGIAIRDDIKWLREIEHFSEAGFVEITTISSKIGIENKGLRGLAALLLKHRISKNMQVTNWAREHLTPMQKIYAATDAWVSREIYFKVKALEKELN